MDALGVILGSSFALWIAHCFSEGVGAHLRLERALRSSEVKLIAIEELNVIAFAVVPVGLLICAGFGLLDIHTALKIGAWSGVGILAVQGGCSERLVDCPLGADYCPQFCAQHWGQ